MARWKELPEHLKGRTIGDAVNSRVALQRVFASAEKSGLDDLATIEGEASQLFCEKVSINKLLPGLNGKDGLIRQSHFKATKVKAGLLELVKAGRHGTFGQARVKIICTRYYCGMAMDFDNASASFKYLVDAIVKAGIIYDDSPKTIEEWTVRQVSVESRKLQKMEVEIILFS